MLESMLTSCFKSIFTSQIMSIIIAIITTAMTFMDAMSNLLTTNIYIGLIEFVMAVIMMALELPNVIICVYCCKQMQKRTHSTRVILIKSIVYILFGIALIVSLICFKVFKGSVVLNIALLWITGIVYVVVFMKNRRSNRHLTFDLPNVPVSLF